MEELLCERAKFNFNLIKRCLSFAKFCGIGSKDFPEALCKVAAGVVSVDWII